MKNYTSTLLIVVAIIIASVLFSTAYKYKFKTAETIVVTGLAETDFTSNQIVWSGRINRYGYDLKQVYSDIKADEKAVKNYLNNKGLPDSSIEFSSIDVQKNFTNKYDNNGSVTGSEFSGYTLSVEVKVNSTNITLVEKISREVTEVLQLGIEFNSQKPLYYYSKLNELKIALLAAASKDGKLRAETIANNADASLGNMKKATMGVFQITGKNDNESYSYGGSFNTSSKEKTASITLRVEYAIN